MRLSRLCLFLVLGTTSIELRSQTAADYRVADMAFARVGSFQVRFDDSANEMISEARSGCFQEIKSAFGAVSVAVESATSPPTYPVLFVQPVTYSREVQETKYSANGTQYSVWENVRVIEMHLTRISLLDLKVADPPLYGMIISKPAVVVSDDNTHWRDICKVGAQQLVENWKGLNANWKR